MAKIAKTIETLSRYGTTIAACCLMAVVAIIAGNIIIRQFIDPIEGVHEVAAFLGALVIALSLARNQLSKENIGVEIIHVYLPKRIQLIVEAVTSLISAIVSALIAWQLLAYGFHLYDSNEVSMTLAMPYYPFIAVVGLCFALLALVLFSDCWNACSGARK